VKNFISFILIIVIIVLAVFAVNKNSQQSNKTAQLSLVNNENTVDLEPADDKSTKLTNESMEIDTTKDYMATIVTSMGTIKVDLFEKETPNTVNNFVKLANQGFYNGLIFHRVIPDFMIQGGDPTGTGTGGPGYKFDDEITGKPIVKGSLAMANSGPNTNGSQFFIVTADETPWLNNLHTNFGQVVEGQDVVDAISMVERDANDKPLTPVTIEKITITQK